MDRLQQPVFIVSSERSGTNLLRRRLSEAQSVYYGPSPLHLLKHFFMREQYYGPLDDDSNFRALAADCLRLAYAHFSPWDEDISLDDVLSEYPVLCPIGGRTSIGLMHVINTIYAQRKGYVSYICKDNNIFDYVYPILTQLPGARFIFLYRDPRDVVASQLKRPMQVKSVAYLGLLWKSEQEKIIQCKDFPKLEQASFELSYERYIADEEVVLQALCQFLSVKYEFSNTIRKFESEKIDITEWENLNKQTIKGNAGKYRNTLSKRQVNTIESIVGPQMKRLGYKTETRCRNLDQRYLKLIVIIAKARRFFMRKVGLVSRTQGQVDRERHISSLPGRY